MSVWVPLSWHTWPMHTLLDDPMHTARSHMRESQGYHFGFVMEQTLGHITHYKNMRAAIDADAAVRATWYPLTYPPRGAFETLPLIRRNWSARASVRAWRTLARREV